MVKTIKSGYLPSYDLLTLNKSLSIFELLNLNFSIVLIWSYVFCYNIKITKVINNKLYDQSVSTEEVNFTYSFSFGDEFVYDGEIISSWKKINRNDEKTIEI